MPAVDGHGGSPGQCPAEDTGDAIFSECPANLVHELFKIVYGNLSVYDTLEHQPRWRSKPGRRPVYRRRAVEPLRGAANEVGIDTRLARDLLDLGERHRAGRFLTSLLGLLELRRSLDDESDFLVVELPGVRLLRHG